MARLLVSLYYGFVLIFGVFVSALFSGVEKSRKNTTLLALFSAAALLLQITLGTAYGISATKKLYPIVTHLPLALFLIFVMKRKPLISIVSILSAYMFCQFPRWFASMGFLIDSENPLCNLIYIAAIIITYILLKRYLAVPVNKFLRQSNKMCLILGAVPLLYYIFDYSTTVYTNVLFMGTKAAVQFMPSVVSVFYFCFVLMYYDEVKKQEQVQKEKNMLTSQMQQAHREMTLLRKMQENAVVYRHDMKHHLVLLQNYAAEGSVDKIREYLSSVAESLEQITPKRFTQNETANLILSSFEAKAQQQGIVFEVSAALPDTIPVNDAEFCALLFNGMENALNAVGNIKSDIEKKIKTEMTVFKNKLLIEIENPCDSKPIIKDGLPQTNKSGHGFGTKSILAIAENHGGHAIFNYKENEKLFNLKIMIPLK